MPTLKTSVQKPFFVLLLAFAVMGASSPKKSTSKKINTQLYESEAEGTISGKVKVLRVIQEETEVFLDVSKGGGGPYVLPLNMKNRASALKSLQKSQAAGGPTVTLTVDDQQRITGVQENESSSSAPGGKPGEKWEL
jgi:hypothetical protein